MDSALGFSTHCTLIVYLLSCLEIPHFVIVITYMHLEQDSAPVIHSERRCSNMDTLP